MVTPMAAPPDATDPSKRAAGCLTKPPAAVGTIPVWGSAQTTSPPGSTAIPLGNVGAARSTRSDPVRRDEA